MSRDCTAIGLKSFCTPEEWTCKTLDRPVIHPVITGQTRTGKAGQCEIFKMKEPRNDIIRPRMSGEEL